ncbi:hypothetical protein M5X00_17650 [Paenibacillus alvei]|uniref:hypothetical protein n=1 Tax=Paenibacillus alvei TaxID=44250 RepID=UPI000288AB8D|nr:hypothetical protein [Paenibacillus alvei]EJW16917.1 hypothetical protein PAV_5c05000 [Paenibacillus alvei DSM 29]EJW19914.1 hypothetical protein PAV_1c09020 [Paenibacillus alvei DSM 29]MCY9543265.1 hypothetical protein [Paenibacillus alvei]MCY9708478.1 hypothetical protein [Paenibacillus alvei]MCY9732201.1 hypothetical protein [Paenibacillus alvei]
MNNTCNKCKHEFDIDIQTRVLYDDVEEVYFTCPNCSEHYHNTFTNANIRKKIMQIQKAIINGHVKRRDKLKRQVNEMVATLKEEVKNRGAEVMH